MSVNHGFTKKKRKLLDIVSKYKLICEVDKGTSKKQDIANNFGIKQNSLSGVLKNRDAMIAAYETLSFSPARKRMCHASHSHVEEALYEWFKAARSQNISLNGPTLMNKKLTHWP